MRAWKAAAFTTPISRRCRRSGGRGVSGTSPRCGSAWRCASRPTSMASTLIGQGMNWWQALLTDLSRQRHRAHPDDAQRAIPARPTASRFRCCCARRSARSARTFRRSCARIVACGWFGIQTWIGGAAIYCDARRFWSASIRAAGHRLPTRHLRRAARGFLLFWAINVYFIIRGMDSIKWLEAFSAPFLLVVGLALLVWAYQAAAWLRADLFEPSKLRDARGSSGRSSAPALTAHGRLLGHALAQHPRLLPLRAQPARPDPRPGDRPADDDGALLVHRHRGHQRHRRRSSAKPSGIRSTLIAQVRQQGALARSRSSRSRSPRSRRTSPPTSSRRPTIFRTSRRAASAFAPAASSPRASAS